MAHRQKLNPASGVRRAARTLNWRIVLDCASRSTFPARICFWLVLTAALITAPRCVAILFYSTANPEHNTTAPTGDLAESWDLQGLWGNYLATPIAPQFFIAAKHIGGNVGDSIRVKGIDYPTTAVFVDTNSDLCVWKIRGQFPQYAQLYAGNDEVGKRLVVFGRGTLRGEEVRVGGLLGSELKGWRWGPGDGRKRWGENRVTTIIVGRKVGPVLVAAFDVNGERDEAQASTGDSSGGVFIQEGTIWKLAGINYAADGLYNTTTSGDGFEAALFDQGGLYKRSEDSWKEVPNSLVDQPGAFYATRISAHLDWIKGIISQPSSASQVVLQSAPSTAGTYTVESGAIVDETARSITLPVPSTARFYRLMGPSPFRISRISVQAGKLVLNYE